MARYALQETGSAGKTPMDQDLDYLYTSLFLSIEKEYECFQELLEALEQEASKLISCTLGDTIGFNSRNDRLLLSVKIASDFRISAISKIISCLHLDEPVTMGQLIAYAPDKTRQNLTDYREKYTDLHPQDPNSKQS